MLDEVLKYITDQLNKKLTKGTEAVVTLPASLPGDSIVFPDNKITLLLLRTEEERIMRQDEPWLRQKIEVVKENGEETINKTVKRMAPPIFLHLYVLLVSRNADYETAIARLSNIIRFFQARRVFDKDSEGWPQKFNDLPELRVELHSPTFTTLNEIWSMLKSPLHPCLMYRITLTLLEDDEPSKPEKLVENVAFARELGEGQSTLNDDSPINSSFAIPLKTP